MPLPAEAMPYPFGEEVVVRAMAQIGTPYRYGGADLGGFDCSGLVYHVYRELGVDAPRTAAAQYEASRRLMRRELRPGDLVFFRTSGRRISHVGIYAGEGRFVHAPQTGRTVELKSLDDTYYASVFAGGGRLVPTQIGIASAP
jgi:cell wall-associated NlpC family hydrolase